MSAVFLVPLHDDAACHGGVLQRHDRVKLPLADDHASGVLSQMARNIHETAGKLSALSNARMIELDACRAEAVLQGVVRSLPFEVADASRDYIDRFLVKAEYFAGLARG
jgi:hypothetical protein